MPWLTILSFLLTYFASRASGASGTKSLITAGLAGAGTYYVTHETDWGQANLGDLDGVSTVVGDDVVKSDGTKVALPDGTALKTVVGGTSDVLKSWGATGTASVIATGAAASGGIFDSENLPYLLGAGVLLLLVLK